MKKNIAPQNFNIDTKNDGLEHVCSVKTWLFWLPCFREVFLFSEFLSSAPERVGRCRNNLFPIGSLLVKIPCWTFGCFQGKSFPYRTSIHLCAIKKQSPNSWYFWDILRSVTPQYNQKTSFFQGKNPSPSCTRTRRLENLDTWKSLQVTVVSDGFFPHRQTNKNIYAAVKVGKHVYFKDWDWTSEKKIVETTNYIWNPFKKPTEPPVTNYCPFFYCIYFFGSIFLGKKLRNRVPTNSFC